MVKENVRPVVMLLRTWTMDGLSDLSIRPFLPGQVKLLWWFLIATNYPGNFWSNISSFKKLLLDITYQQNQFLQHINSISTELPKKLEIEFSHQKIFFRIHILVVSVQNFGFSRQNISRIWENSFRPHLDRVSVRVF